MITVKHVDADTWEVTVAAGTTTRHRVRVTNADLEHLGGGASAEELLQESFQFLLERESNTSILSSFNLPVISSYFPDYEGEIRQRLGAR
jgi:hypothetical protein